MTPKNACEIASLLNSRNELTRQYDSKLVLKGSDNFVYIIEKGKIVACAEAKPVQWYQWEICHVSVLESEERKGFGRAVLELAEKRAIKGQARILQCTIRVNNSSSKKLFESSEYSKTCTFLNKRSRNKVDVYQKVVSI